MSNNDEGKAKMKITDTEIIRSGERELIDAITADLDWGAVEDIFREQHNLGIDEDVQYRRGDIVVHNNQVAYSLEFEVKVTVSVMMDRDGNHISVRLPDARMDNGDDGEPPSGGEDVPDGRILIVEDEPAIQLALSGLLRREGYEVIPATSGH